jgi:hypothetical protein
MDIAARLADGQIMVSDGRDGFYLNQPCARVEHARPGSVRTLWEGDQIAIGFVRLLRPIGGFLYLGGEKGLPAMTASGSLRSRRAIIPG